MFFAFVKADALNETNAFAALRNAKHKTQDEKKLIRANQARASHKESDNRE